MKWKRVDCSVKSCGGDSGLGRRRRIGGGGGGGGKIKTTKVTVQNKTRQ